MQKNLKNLLSLLLTLVMVLGMIPFAVFASETQVVSDLPTSIDGLSIAYPYNTETVQLTGTPVSRFNALTFESTRGEVESAQMILTPSFAVSSFELTINSLKNEKGNIIPSWAFEVYTQHYVTVSGSGNAPNYSSKYNMYNPTYSTTGFDGTFPDALIPQDVAIEAGENTIAAGNNQGIWVNLNVQDAAPGTYTGYAILTVNGSAMQIPVSVHIYDVQIPEQVHAKSSIAIWWDMLQAGEGYVDDALATVYFDYLVSKRIMPMDKWNLSRWDDSFTNYAVNYLAVSPEISAYSIYAVKDANNNLESDTLKATLTTLINKNIELVKSGSDIDLFAKAYFRWLYDEPRNDKQYALVNTLTAQLDAVKAELAPMLADYPNLQESFMNVKQLVTAPNPTDKTYTKVGTIFNYFINDNYGSTALTGDSYIYCPQYQWLNSQTQRAMYANEEELWWYGCCHPISPYPTYHINSPLVSARLEGWMRYAYGIDGFVYASVNYWGQYNDDGSVGALYDFWNGYKNNGTPGDQILVLPGSDYGVYGPIGTIRIENIREANEEYEYLWMLENEYGIADISTYTAGLYEGTMPTTDTTAYYNSRKALLTKLEQLSSAKYGATEIAPGEEVFVRGDLYAAAKDATIQMDESVEAVGLSFEYKVIDGENFNIAIMNDWYNHYSYYAFGKNGPVNSYDGVSYEVLDNDYIRVVMDFAKLTKVSGTPGNSIDFIYVRGDWSNAEFYLDKLELLTQLPEVEEPSEPETEPTEPEMPVQGYTYVPGTGATIVLDNDQPVTNFSFDYTIDSGEYFHAALMPDWSNYYGYLKFGADGAMNNYAGIVTKKLDDGVIRVYVDLTKVTNIVGTPSNVLQLLYIRGDWTNATGTISNICFNEDAQMPLRGETFEAGISKTIVSPDLGELSAISFDYKILSGERFNIFLGTDWSNYYGLYKFVATGAAQNYAGVTTEVLEDGYIRVTFDVAALTTKVGTPTSVIKFLFIRGDWTDANGYIDNVQYVTHVHSHTAVVTAPTCTTAGYTTYTCACGDTYTADETEALGHNYESVVTEPTPSAQGYTTHTCTGCGDSYVDSYTDYEVEGYLSLTEDMNVNLSLTEDFYVNLNGHTMTGTINTNGFKVYGIDTTTDNYTCEDMGYFDCVDEQGNAVVPESNNKTELTGSIKRYLTIETENGYTFHRFYIGISHMTLKPGATGVGYKAIFGGDDMVKAQLHETEAYGYQLWIDGGNPVSRFKSREEYVSGKNLTLLLKNFDVEKHGETVVYANVYIKLADNSVITSSEYSLTLRDLVEIINDTYTSYTDAQLQAVRDMIDRNPVMQNWRVENLFKQEVIRGDAVDTTVGKTILLNNTEILESISFEYKMVDGTKFNIALMPDWNSSFGYFAFGPDGARENYAGVTTEILEDGYVRVTFDMNALTKMTGTPSKVIDFLYIRSYDWSDAQCYIDNVSYTVYKPTLNFAGAAYVPGTGAVIELKDGKVNDLAVTRLTFDYTVESGEYFHAALMPDWSSYYGYYKFDANGVVGNYPGVVTKKLEDGSVRAYIDLSKAATVGNPSNVITMLYVRGDWTNASGTVSNICINDAAEYAPRGELVDTSAGKTIVLDNTQNLNTISFDYKMVDGTKFNIALMPDWSNYFGYFAFGADGTRENYAGITTEVLEDGYIRVTFDLNAMTKKSGSPSTAIALLYIRSYDWSDANCYIDNLQYS